MLQGIGHSRKESLYFSRWTKYEINWYETLNYDRIQSKEASVKVLEPTI